MSFGDIAGTATSFVFVRFLEKLRARSKEVAELIVPFPDESRFDSHPQDSEIIAIPMLDKFRRFFLTQNRHGTFGTVDAFYCGRSVQAVPSVSNSPSYGCSALPQAWQ